MPPKTTQSNKLPRTKKPSEVFKDAVDESDAAKSSSDDDAEESGLDAKLLRAIKKAVQDVLKKDRQSINKKLDRIATTLSSLNDSYTILNTAMEDCSARIDKAITQFFPALNQKVADVSTALAIRAIDMDAHSRKWSLVIQGLPGAPGETSDVTRKKCVKLASSHLNVPDAALNDIAACHRLNNKDNAAIIIRFLDLDKRNRWLYGAKGLSEHPGRISMSPDLPPVTRELKAELMTKRKALDNETKKLSSIRYLKTFPYVTLNIQGKDPIVPSVTREALVKAYLNVDPLMKFIISD